MYPCDACCIIGPYENDPSAEGVGTRCAGDVVGAYQYGADDCDEFELVDMERVSFPVLVKYGDPRECRACVLHVRPYCSDAIVSCLCVGPEDVVCASG